MVAAPSAKPIAVAVKKSTKAKAKAKKAAAKKVALKLQPGAASKAAVAALPKAPKDELIKWVRANLIGEPESTYVKVHNYLNGQMINSIQDLVNLGATGVRALHVGSKLRFLFIELLLKHIGQTTGTDDGLMVPTPKLVKAEPPAPKKKCSHTTEPAITVTADEVPAPINAETARFVAISVDSAAPSPVGDWLRRAFPDVKPTLMSRTIIALQRQTIRTFADLRRVGMVGLDSLHHVPTGVRQALAEAIIYHIGTEGHDDGKPVTATRYVAPKPVKQDCSSA